MVNIFLGKSKDLFFLHMNELLAYKRILDGLKWPFDLLEL